MTIHDYIKNIKKIFTAGISTEHSYRGDLQDFVKELVKDITITNEPKRQKCGAPDYIIEKKEVPIGYIEAKDIGTDLNKIEKNEQLKRYLNSLDNLVLTDYLDFRFFRFGQKIKEIKIAAIENNVFKEHSENYDSLITHLKDFCTFKGQSIKSAEKLAGMMAQKARMMEEVIYNALLHEDENNTLIDQLEAFREILIHDLSQKEFADIYAQTIAYGLFAARLHDKSIDNFSREEAMLLVSRSNPFLRQLFTYVAGSELDARVVWIVNDLAEIFRATDLKEILKDFGNFTQQNDPFIHFYETFLSEYDPKLRKSRGVYYTPEPIVNFIVRAVDDILRTEFNLAGGLSDTTKTIIKIESHTSDGRVKNGFKMIDKEIHKVQILDPAAGTGTFLSEVVKHIYKNFKGQEGIWSNYVEEHLLPRLNGFEILMAPYTMCHLKLELLLKETGYKSKEEKKEERLRVFLTNSLEEVHPDTGTLFVKNWLSNEAIEANFVKQSTPVMVVLGNPPYANFGQMNKGEWIRNLIADYKKDLNEKKINLDDDYIKFIRYGEYFINKNGEGILAYISNNSFIDGITHRQMRKHLLETFDKIYILDLHGNAKKLETCPDGSKDENVFDIMQGVSINIFIKNNKKKKGTLGKVYHSELYGIRENKYNQLWKNNINKTNFNELKFNEPYYFFVPKNFIEENIYISGFKTSDIFPISNNGLQTDRDSLFIDFDKNFLKNRIIKLFKKEFDESYKKQFRIVDSSSYKLTKVIELNSYNEKYIRKVFYRPFDLRYIYFDSKVISRPAQKVFKHFQKVNIALIISRQQSTFSFQHILITNEITERCSISLQTKETGYVFPLYLYPDSSDQELEGFQSRTPNLNMEIVNQIADKTGLKFTPEKEIKKDTFSPIDILDYIYAVLHSPSYREKYKEFLKIDFPRVPFPASASYFREMVKMGTELRELHLLESPKVNKFITAYPKDGDNDVTSVKYDEGKVRINEQQYFDKVPQVAWEFYIGGYQPAQKWLKDRKGLKLSFEDIRHYQKIIVALTETDKIMKEIDKKIEL